MNDLNGFRLSTVHGGVGQDESYTDKKGDGGMPPCTETRKQDTLFLKENRCGEKTAAKFHP